jgi:hypothetical protein
MHSIDMIDHQTVDIQFSEHGEIMYVKCPYNKRFIDAVKINLVKDGQAHYEFDNVSKKWAFYSWGEDWAFASVLTLLWCFYPAKQLSKVNLEGMKV